MGGFFFPQRSDGRETGPESARQTVPQRPFRPSMGNETQVGKIAMDLSGTRSDVVPHGFGRKALERRRIRDRVLRQIGGVLFSGILRDRLVHVRVIGSTIA